MMLRSSEASISDNSKVIAYYSLLSIFPLLIVIGNILPYFQLDVMSVADYVQTAVPPTIFDKIMPVLQSLLKKQWMTIDGIEINKPRPTIRFNNTFELPGDFPLVQISPTHIQSFADVMKAEGLKETSIRIYLTLIKVILNYARKMANLSKGSFSWHSDFNISFIRNKLTALLDNKRY